MKSLFSYLLVMFMILFWGFRIVVAINASLDAEFVATPLDFNMEIAIIFVTLLCIILVVKRNIIGGLLYVFAYGLYFGIDLYNKLLPVIQEGTQLELNQVTSVFFSAIGMFLPLIVLLELLFDKNSKNHPTDKKTDWYYKNEQYDRQLDERADKNNYRTL